MSSSSQSDKGLRERKNANTEEKLKLIQGDEIKQEHKVCLFNKITQLHCVFQYDSIDLTGLL